MKKNLLLLVLVCYSIVNGQILKLQELSKNELISSNTLYDENDRDIFGYFYFFKNNKIDKKIYEFEYFLIDKNLNLVISGKFIESFNAFGIAIYAIYKNGFISLRIDNASGFKYKIHYRLLNIKENTISESFKLPDSIKNLYTSDEFYKFFPINSGYYISNLSENIKDKKNKTPKKLYYTDEQFNIKWSYEYAQTKRKKVDEYVKLRYNNENSDIIIGEKIFEKRNMNKNKDLHNSILFFNKKTGEIINEIKYLKLTTYSNKDIVNEAYTRKVFISKDSAIIINMTTNSKKGIFDKNYY